MNKIIKYFYRLEWLFFILLSLILSCLIILISCPVQWKSPIQPMSSVTDYQTHLNKRINILMKKYSIPGCSIAIVRNGDIVLTNAYGFADLKDSIALTTDTPMRVQSISKSVTAWAVMKLYEGGLIDLDMPISNYLKSWKFPPSKYKSATITIRNLLSHTSGIALGDVFTIYNPYDQMPSLKEKLTKEAILVQNPNAGFIYSNTGFNLLELLIEEVTGRDFEEYMFSEILIPLGMNNSSFEWSSSMDPQPPKGYDLNGREVPIYVYPEKASGGLFATAEDIARFVIAGMNEEGIISSKSIGDMYSIHSDGIGIYGLVFEGYGLGHYIEILPNGMRSISHGGQGSGIMTHFQVVPEIGDGIVILTNSQRSWPFIAHLLRDWRQWTNISSVGMESIIWGDVGIALVVGIIISVTIFFIIKSIMINTKKVIKKKKKNLLFEIIKFTAVLVIIGVLIWSKFQKYLFITSVFPTMSLWFGWSLLLFSIGCLFDCMYKYQNYLCFNIIDYLHYIQL